MNGDIGHISLWPYCSYGRALENQGGNSVVLANEKDDCLLRLTQGTDGQCGQWLGTLWLSRHSRHKHSRHMPEALGGESAGYKLASTSHIRHIGLCLEAMEPFGTSYRLMGSHGGKPLPSLIRNIADKGHELQRACLDGMLPLAINHRRPFVSIGYNKPCTGHDSCGAYQDGSLPEVERAYCSSGEVYHKGLPKSKGLPARKGKKK